MVALQLHLRVVGQQLRKEGVAGYPQERATPDSDHPSGPIIVVTFSELNG